MGKRRARAEHAPIGDDEERGAGRSEASSGSSTGSDYESSSTPSSSKKKLRSVITIASADEIVAAPVKVKEEPSSDDTHTVAPMGGQEDSTLSDSVTSAQLSPPSSVAADDEDSGADSSNAHSTSVCHYASDGVKYPEYHRQLILKAAAKMVNPKSESQDQEDCCLRYTVSSCYSSKPPREPEDEDRKIFVGGLSFDTSEFDLEKYFSRFGMVILVNLKYDCMTGISRGFGFVSFAEGHSVDAVLDNPIHVIHGRYIEARRAKSRPIYKKVFVGGIDETITEKDIRTYFSRFGVVDDVDIPLDRQRNIHRNFCFIYFDCEEAADEATTWPRQMIKNKLVDVRKTLPQPLFKQQKRIAQAAGLDLSEFDCNYKYHKLMTTARMVSASAALATHGLATALPGYYPNLPGAIPGAPQLSVTTNGAVVPFQDHIKSASLAAMAVANSPNAFPAATSFAANCLNAATSEFYEPSAYQSTYPASYTHTQMQSLSVSSPYMAPYPSIYSMAQTMPPSMPSIAPVNPTQTLTSSQMAQSDSQTAAAALAVYASSYGFAMGSTSAQTTHTPGTSYHNSVPTSSADPYTSRISHLPALPARSPAPPSTSSADTSSHLSVIPSNATGAAATAATAAGVTIMAAAYSYTNGKA